MEKDNSQHMQEIIRIKAATGIPKAYAERVVEEVPPANFQSPSPGNLIILQNDIQLQVTSYSVTRLFTLLATMW